MEAVFELLIPLVMSDIVDVGIANADQSYILRKGGLMVALAVASAGVAAADGAADQALFLHPVQHAVDGGGLHPEELRQLVLRDPPAVLLEVEEYMGLGRGSIVNGFSSSFTLCLHPTNFVP